ncbi:MAG: NnrS family protein [Gammaproteobacteria bacterium]|nr:NnrS family protein [Gammaproteobacteria bacterium]
MLGSPLQLYPGPDEPVTQQRGGWHFSAVFAYGFRPFFLLAGLHASVAIPLWVALLHGAELPRMPLPAHTWHAHEMLFGFVVAAVAGFLLTAVPSWTNRRGYAGLPLVSLVTIWLGGRLAMSVPLGLPSWLVAAVDLVFIPLLALAILPALLRSGNRRNLAFIGLLVLLFASNLHFHLLGGTSTGPLLLGFNVILFLVTMLGGRIVPAFTSAGLKQQGLDVRIRRFQPLDRAALLAVAAVLVFDLFDSGSYFAGFVALVAAALLAVQLAHWQGLRTSRLPLLWVLHLGYAWLPICLALKAAWLFGVPVASSSWLHALTVGAFGTMILGVMSRAALGHTGRQLVAPAGAVAAYILITGAAISRVFVPMLVPNAVTLAPVLAGVLWTLAFGLFVVTYAPILLRPRADGRPG